jgi:anti-sigma regulatory factor (Ser/Thr protein kinase)
MTAAACHASFEIADLSRVGEARRAAVLSAEALGFDEVAAGRVALIATELGSNLFRHARGGRLLVGVVEGPGGDRVVELLSLDSGPGVTDLGACLEDGYSTGSTPGTGLGAVRRLSNEFDAFSQVPFGTVILARVAAKSSSGSNSHTPPAAGAFEVGAVALAAPGETVCGDSWSVVREERRLSLLVADGLGHGPIAREAAEAAVDEFEVEAFRAPSEVLGRVHRQLRSTRGAAVAMVQVDGEDDELVFCGAGNIAGRLISGIVDRTLMSQHGTAGVQIRSLRDVKYPWPEHALLVMHSDGLTTRWTIDAAPGLLRRHPSVIAAWLIRDQARGRDDVTVVVVRRGSG